MTWNTLLGHEWAAQLLKQHMVHNAVRHAYLFTGTEGVGRRTLALCFAQALHCLYPPAPGEPCGECQICQQTKRMDMTDLSIVQSEPDSHTIKIEQIRDLQHILSLAPYQTRYRVAVLLRFEEATVAAQNALLKTLEEPPQKVILLLTADAAENLLPTIVSRCEVLRLRPLSVERLAEALQTHWGVNNNEAWKLAHLANGRPGYALRLHQNPQMLKQLHAWGAEMFELLAESRRARFAYVEKVAKSREELRPVLVTWLSLWRDVMLAAVSTNAPLTNLEFEPQIHRLAETVGWSKARACTVGLERALAQLEANVNIRLLVENILLDWPRLTVG